MENLLPTRDQIRGGDGCADWMPNREQLRAETDAASPGTASTGQRSLGAGGNGNTRPATSLAAQGLHSGGRLQRRREGTAGGLQQCVLLGVQSPHYSHGPLQFATHILQFRLQC
eukprot:GGOE01011187.1.p3 GENE.GGOE01011187.1~~GGOE01011187.1.p3  ORF type:complete len:114 (+),score=2.55 GGOE01011187.1:1909-2250(+)